MENKSVKNKKFSLNSLIYNDKYLMVVSLILAVFVWIGTSLNMGTDENKTITFTVPVSLGDQVSEQLGVQFYPLQDTVELNVTISGAKYIIGQIKQEDLSVKFDTSSVKRTGAQNVPIIVTNKSKYLDYTVSSVSPSSIECYFDVNSSKSLDVDVLYDEDNVADGYMFATPVLSEDRIYVTGPKTYIDRIESAYVQMNFGDAVDLTEPVNQKCSILFKGTGIDTNYIDVRSSAEDEKTLSDISVTLPVLKVQTLPVTTSFVGKPQELADDIIDVKYSVNELKGGILDSANISKADIGTIDFSKLKVGENTFTFEAANASGIAVIDSVEYVTATVTVSDSYKEFVIPISSRNVNIEGLPDGKKATIDGVSQTYVTVVAPANSVISRNNIIIKCDLTDKTESGTYDMQISVANNKTAWVYGSYTCAVTIK